MAPFIATGSKKMDGAVKPYYVMYTEKSIGLRKKLIRGTSTLNQVEMLYLVTANEPEFAEKSHRHFEGTNLGNVLGPVSLEHPDDVWKLTYKEKVGVYGPTHRHRVGGPGDADPKAKTDKRVDDTIEPVFYRTLPLPFWDDMMSSFHLKGMVHLTLGDGHAAVAACENGIPILGICLSDSHCTALHKRLVEQVYLRMQDPHSTLFHSALKAELAEEPGAKGEKRKNNDCEHSESGDEPVKKAGKPKGTPAANQKNKKNNVKKKKSTRGKKTDSVSNSSPSSSSSDSKD